MYSIYINNKKLKDFDEGYSASKILKHYLFVYQNEDVRLKNRVLDLRRPEMNERIITRSKITSLIRNFLDENDHHFHIQIRKRRFTISLDGVRTVDVDTDADLVAAKGYPAFGIYEASTSNPWIKIRDFKIRNYTANAKSNSYHAGGNKFIQLSRPSCNTTETFTAQDMGMDDNEVALIHVVLSGGDLQDWAHSFFHWRMPRGSNSEIVTPNAASILELLNA